MCAQELEVRRVFAELLPGGLVLYGPEAAAIIATGFDQIAAYARRDGINHFSPSVERIRQVAAAAAAQASRGHDPHAGSGHEDVSWSGDSAGLEAWIGTAEAAEVLGLSVRQTSRLIDKSQETGIPLGKVRKSQGHYRVRRDEVTAYAARRREEESA